MTRENFISIVEDLIRSNRFIAKYLGKNTKEGLSLQRENTYLEGVINALRREDFIFDEEDEPYEEGLTFLRDEYDELDDEDEENYGEYSSKNLGLDEEPDDYYGEDTPEELYEKYLNYA